jgi:hypothetical protein
VQVSQGKAKKDCFFKSCKEDQKSSIEKQNNNV